MNRFKWEQRIDENTLIRRIYLLGTLFVVVLLYFLMAGCTMYTVEKTDKDGNKTFVSVKSTRSFEQPDLSYTRTGADATFDFKAAGADNNTDAIITLFAPLIQGIMTGAIVVQPPLK